MKTRIPLIAAILLVGVIRLNAATIPVTSTADSGAGSLRTALASAANGDTIDATGVSGTILLTTGELLVTNSLTIAGPGPGSLTVDGNAASRVIHIGSNTVVSISSLTVRNGHVASPKAGGGIWNDHGALTVSNCTLSGNSSGLYGGGIANDSGGGSASLEILNSTLSDNSGVLGGGIINFGAGGSASLKIVNSTFSRNSAPGGGGGGINNDGCCGGSASMEIVNSTVTGNSAFSGGGIFNGGANGSSSAEIVNCTISGNFATRGGGIDNNDFGVGSATLVIGSTVLNADASGGTITNDSGTVTSLGYNLSSDDGNGLLTATGDQINTDPLLGPLADNGGPTFTYALLPGSPCINAGDPAFAPPPDFDQRGPGFPRVVDGRIDIGAFEVQPPTDSDEDGILDVIDQCPNTLPGAIVDSTGCSIAQLVPCDGTWKNHGQYVSAVTHEANKFLAAGLITGAQKGAIVAGAAQSNCGR